MRFLLDMPVSPKLLAILQNHGHSGAHAHQLGYDRAPDSDLLQLARSEGMILITADLDFPRLLALSMAEGPGLILFRGGNYTDVEMCALLDQVLERLEPSVLAKSVCSVDARRIRVTELPLGG